MRLFTTLLAAALLAGCSLPKMIKTVEDINLEVNPSLLSSKVTRSPSTSQERSPLNILPRR